MKAKKSIFLIILITLFLLLFYFGPLELLAKEKFEEKFEKVVPLSKYGKVILKNISGNIKVKSWDKAEVKIEAIKISKAPTLSEAKENARRIKIEVNKENNTLLIETKYPTIIFKSLNVSLNYHLTIPFEAEIKTKSVSGDVFLEKMGGEIEARTVSGNITIDEAKKEIYCKAVSGDLNLQNIKGDIDVRTVSGNIHLINIKGSIEADSVSGDIEIRDASEVKKLKAKAVSGSIIYQGKIQLDGEYDFNSHSGDIHLEIPSDSAFDLEASTFSGKIKSEFEITISGEISRRKIRGSVNGGGADVNISTFSGNIILKKK
jgi:DUF4097 and DUF4098 domain-containing protein YvlB